MTEIVSPSPSPLPERGRVRGLLVIRKFGH